MRLKYYKKANFGDALNPLIFNKLLPGFFDEDPDIDFFGIGSIIGIPMVRKAKRKIIFSSGFAYGKIPQLDSSYDVICVRGPLSAKALNLDKKFGIADGALLLREFQFDKVKKEYEYSFMPHWESERKFPWEAICSEAGIHYVSPTSTPEFIISEILKSKSVIAEAMHYAIVADTLRVPWTPVKAYPSINEFKWQDWTASLGMEFKPIHLPALYEPAIIKDFLSRRSPVKLPELVYDFAGKVRSGYEDLFLKRKVINNLKKAQEVIPQLSKESLFNSKVDNLLDRLEFVKNKYKDSERLICQIK